MVFCSAKVSGAAGDQTRWHSVAPEWVLNTRDSQRDGILHSSVEEAEPLRPHCRSIFTHRPSSFTRVSPSADAPPRSHLLRERPHVSLWLLQSRLLGSQSKLLFPAATEATLAIKRYSTQTSRKGKSGAKTLAVSHTPLGTVSGSYSHSRQHHIMATN